MRIRTSEKAKQMMAMLELSERINIALDNKERFFQYQGKWFAINPGAKT